MAIVIGFTHIYVYMLCIIAIASICMHMHMYMCVNVQFVALSGPVQGGIATPILNRFMHLNRTKTDTMLKDGV